MKESLFKKLNKIKQFCKNTLTNLSLFSIILLFVQGYSSVGRVLVSKPMGRGFKSFCPCQKIQVERLGFFHLCRRTQHHLRATHATSFSRRLTSFRRKADTNERGCTSCKWCASQWCGLTPNDVALRANGIRPIVLCAEILLIFNRKCGIIKAARRWYRERR